MLELSRPRKYAATREDVLVEQTLIEKAQSGDSWAIGKLYMDHAAHVRRLLLSMLGPGNSIEDLVQDIFIQVFCSIHNFKGNSRFSTWLHRVAVNTALTSLRQKKRIVAGTENSDALSTDARQESITDTQTQLKELYRILDSLPAKRRIAFVLFEIEQLTLEEIASVTQSNVAAIKSRLFFARREILKKAAARPVLRELMDNADTGESR